MEAKVCDPLVETIRPSPRSLEWGESDALHWAVTPSKKDTAEASEVTKAFKRGKFISRLPVARLRGRKCSNQSFKLATGLTITGLEAKETSNVAFAFSVGPTPLTPKKLDKYMYAYLRKVKLLGHSNCIEEDIL